MTPIHSSNDSAGQLLSTLRKLTSYGRGEPPYQLNQPRSGIRTRGKSNSLITNSDPGGKSERFGSCNLSLIARLYGGRFMRAAHQRARTESEVQRPSYLVRSMHAF